jgi:hypothetical protein
MALASVLGMCAAASQLWNALTKDVPGVPLPDKNDLVWILSSGAAPSGSLGGSRVQHDNGTAAGESFPVQLRLASRQAHVLTCEDKSPVPFNFLR